MKNKDLLVSIITVVYNARDTLEQTIHSVLNQTYKNIEYIIIDGGSSDGTIEIIKRYEKNIAYWSSESDAGISDAFNKGIKQANGKLVGILNADDWYEADAIETVVKNYTDAYGVYCGTMTMVNSEGAIVKSRKSNYHRLSLGMYIMHPTTFVRKDVYEKVGLFDTNYKLAMDFDLMMRIDKAGFKFNCLDHNLAYMRVGGASCDVNAANKEALKVIKTYRSRIIYLRAKLFTFLNTKRMQIIKD